jgi:polyribonucleotide nucleotidyltransferase
MATVCAGTMSLMDTGVKIKKPVSGIAMGLITDESGKFAILSDILGDEDHLGDMDFKVAGTVDGITATQMDIKVDGLPYEVLAQALEQARQGRLHILEKMLEVIPEPREDYKENVPRLETIIIPKDMIGAVIGPGGKVIQKLQEETDTVIVIEEEGDTGIVQVSSTNKSSIEAALEQIRLIIAVPEINEIYHGTVKSILSFGAFIEILPGKDGLLHISEYDWKRLDSLDDVLSEGDELDVKLIGIEEKTGKLKLSRKVLLEKPEGYVERPSRDNRSSYRGGGRNDNRGGGNRNDNRGRGRNDNRGGGNRNDHRDYRK